MDDRQRRRLERYLVNASHFLWGLGPGNQRENYEWLRSRGFEFESGPYARVIAQLVEKYGIEELLRRLIVPRVRELFSEKAIDYLRDCWRAGTKPAMSFLKLYNIRDPFPLLVINTQFNYVERWGELAGVWFEEIEAFLGEKTL